MASIGRNLEIMQAVRLINRKLGAVAAAVEDKVKPSMITQMALIAREIKSIAPVDETSEHPGELKDSVRLVEGESTAKKAFVVKVVAGGQGTIKSGFNYPRGVEFGIQGRPAHPFFWVIWRLRRKGPRQVVRKVAVKAVREVFGDK